MTSGFVDLHLHLLFEVDDGARSASDTLQMARALISLGFTEAAPSPHNRSEYPSHSAALVAGRLREVKDLLAKEGLALELHDNAENFFLDDDLLANGRKLGTGSHMLIEAPYTSSLPALREIIFQLQLKGITPLIAHPERCLEFEKKGRAAEMVGAGAKLQLDIGALIGRYGGTAKKLARQFLEQGLYEVAASDLHSPVNAEGWLGESIEALRKLGGDEGLQQLLSKNPRALLTC